MKNIVLRKLLAATALLIFALHTGNALCEGVQADPEWFLPTPETHTPVTSPDATETPAPNAFRFRNGIRWGMNTQQVKALETETMSERTMQNWSIMLTEGKVAVSRFTADLVFMFREDRLLMTSYEFQKGLEDDYLYLTGALESVYGGKKDADPLKIKALMDAINPNRYRTELIRLPYGWITEDGTTVFLYYYAADAFAITYVSPELGRNVYQTNGL